MLTADPVRLAAIASPMPEARRSVGKSSGRYTYTKLEAADRTPANSANRTVIATGGRSVHTVRMSMVPAAIPKLPTRKLLRDTRSTTIRPATAPPSSPIQTGLRLSCGARLREIPMIPSPNPSLNTPPELPMPIRK